MALQNITYSPWAGKGLRKGVLWQVSSENCNFVASFAKIEGICEPEDWIERDEWDFVSVSRMVTIRTAWRALTSSAEHNYVCLSVHL